LSRYLASAGATADYQLNLDIRSFELDAQRSEVHIDVAATIVSTTSGRIAAVEIFDLTAPVAATDASNVVAALDNASAGVMTKIVAFVAKSL
ncbi:MAG TPA: ABC-type transport auxiliary lipoprotein family protein, partial [Roseiarcus sp.]|nr:ABC-type transport auxiliary lipoprotein family protein [Roseiarcus sp.]